VVGRSTESLDVIEIVTRSNIASLVALTWLFISASAVGDPVSGSPESKHGPPVMGNASFWLSSDEVRELWPKATNGDNDASYRLANYYAFIKLDQDRAAECYRLGAERGHSESQLSLGALLVTSRDSNRFDEAERWLNLAKRDKRLILSADSWLEALARARKRR